MKFEGEKQQAVCTETGEWSVPTPRCLAPCLVPRLQHGTTQLQLGARLGHGEELAISCAEQHELQRPGEPVTCEDGSWSQAPDCGPARCKAMPTPPRNGMVVVPHTGHLSMALYQCKVAAVLPSVRCLAPAQDGFTLSGDNTTTCMYGEWTGTTPACRETYCRFPGYLAHGKILLVGNMGLYDYRPYVKKITNDRQIIFDCDKGYKLELGRLVTARGVKARVRH